MSDTHTKARAKSNAAFRHVALGLALTLSLGLVGTLRALADGELALKNVKADANKQLVIEFATGMGAPQAPTLSEVPSPNHQLLIDFAGVSLDQNTIPAGDQLTSQLVAVLPGVRRASVGVLAAASVPTVRVALELDPDLAIKPTVAALQEGAAVINLGDNYGVTATAAASGGGGQAVGSSASTDPAAAYEEYYRKFLQQKQLTEKTAPTAEWGPRKGTIDEARRIKSAGGVRIIGTPVNSPVLADVQLAPSPAPARATRRRAGQVVAQAPAAVEPVATATPAAAAPVAQEQTAPIAAAPTAAPAPDETAAAPTPVESAAPAPVESAAAPVTQIADTAPTPRDKEKEETQMQPDMVADDSGSTTVAPAAAAESATPAAKGETAAEATAAAPPGPERHKLAAAAPAAAAEESAASPNDAAAASAGAAAGEIRSPKEQDKAENQEPMAAEESNALPAGESSQKRARRLFNQGYQSHVHGRIAEAIVQYKEAIKVNSELGDAHSNLGLAYNQQHNYANALSEFYKALAINPRDAITYNGIGAALRAEHDIAGAIKNWETAVKLDPKLAVAHYNLGTAYEAENESDKALAAYEAAVKNDQNLGEAYFRMGLICNKKHRLQEARAHFKKSLSVSGDTDYAAEARQKIANIDKVVK